MAILPRLDHMVLTTRDPLGLMAFYQEKLGLSGVWKNGRAALAVGCQKINLHPWPSPFRPLAGHRRTGGQAFALSLPFSQIPAFSPSSQEILVDPDGNAATLHDGPLFLRSISLATRNPSGAARFYTSFLDFQCSLMPDCAILTRGEAEIRLYPAQSAETIGIGDFCLLAGGDMEAVRGRLARRGAPVLADPGIVERSGATGPIWSVYLRDGDGNLVEVATPCPWENRRGS